MFCIIITILLCITFLSFCIRDSYNIKKSTNNKYINNWNNFVFSVSNNIYPDKLDDTKKYHITKFWRLFDFSFFSLVVYLLLNYKK